MNTISQGMSKEAETIFKEHILNDSNVKAVVFISGKPDNFIAGADIDMIKAVENKVKASILKWQRFDKICLDYCSSFRITIIFGTIFGNLSAF